MSLVGLWLSRKEVPRWFAGTTLVLALFASGVMAWTANLGGQIHHPEIRSEAPMGISPAVGSDSGEAYEYDDD